MQFLATIHVMLKRDVADVQGMAIEQALRRHGDPVSSVKAGKYFEFEIEEASEAAARARVERLAEEAFCNPTIEHAWWDIEERRPTA